MSSRLRDWVSRLLRRFGRVALVIALVCAAAVVVHAANRSVAARQAAPGPDPTPVYSRQPYSSGYGPQSSPSPSATRDAEKPEVKLALRFTSEFLDTSGGKQAWLDRMRPDTNPNYLDALSTTDVSRVPQGKLVGFVKQEPTVHSDVWVTVHTTAGDFRVYSARRNMSDQWWINSIEPVSTP